MSDALKNQTNPSSKTLCTELGSIFNASDIIMNIKDDFIFLPEILIH